jgi:hypothetical protein
MHGEITLESALDHGTKATFCIPFNKPQFTGNASPLVDLGSLPERLQSENSVSGAVSEYERSSGAPPQSPPDSLGVALPSYPQRRDSSGNRPRSKHPSTTDMNRDFSAQDFDRQKTHVLIVEDK